MKTTRLFLTIILIALLGNPIHSRADDIDIYSGLPGSANAPNVMFVIDNSANSDAAMQACTYWDGASPTYSNTSNKAGDDDMCALDTVVHNMTTRSDGSALVNIGITLQSGLLLELTPLNDNPYTGTCPASTCVAIPAGKTNRQAISYAIRQMSKYTGSHATHQGEEFQETWAYYTGGNATPKGSDITNVGVLSNTHFTGTDASTGCQKNYVIFISSVSGSGSSHAHTGGELAPLTAAVNNLEALYTANPASGVGVSSAQGTALLTTIAGEPENPYAIEWARFMYSTDANNSANGTQSIVSYSIAGGSPTGVWATMSTMEQYIDDIAKYGGGKYFPGADLTTLENDIIKILNEVQSVNSVFASSSLPVSVNAQGTYLNQIYMGMFRPDANGFPRWLGNVKQYQFGYDPTGQTLTLADSLGSTAISSSGTGFISPNAISFWTCTNLTTVTNPYVSNILTAAQRSLLSNNGQNCTIDPSSGFWVNNPQSAGGAYDLSDGEIVEKGGAAQKLRNANLLDNYAANPGTSTNPRNVYTYCPNGVGCVAALSDSSNAFATTNANITAGMFDASNVSVHSIVRTGTTALVTTNSAHGFSTGTSVTISGAIPTDYNVTQTLTAPNINSTTSFTITGLGDYPNSPSTGAYSASLHNSSTKSISSVSVATSTTANTNGCASGTIPNINCDQVTVTLPNHGYSNGNTIVIAGVTPSTGANVYSGSFVIGNVTANTFTYNVPVTPTSPSVNAYSAQRGATSLSISGATVSGNHSVITTSAPHGLTIGSTYTATISGVVMSSSPANSCTASQTFNGGPGTITVTSATQFTESFDAAGSKSCYSSGGTVAVSQPVISIAAGNISRASATATTATATGITASAFSNGQTVQLAYVSGAGISEDAYALHTGANNTVVITCSGICTSFTFPITTLPSTTLTTSSPTAALAATPVTIPAGAITRTSMSTTATVAANAGFTGANGFSTGASIDIGVSGVAVGTESAYVGTWTITCPTACTNGFTFGPVALTPTTPAAGTITAFGGTSPDRASLVNWVRGQDNAGDEPSPDPTYAAINVRGSIHGDVLHSRPAVINYGGTTGVVVFYGANDGTYRAINGNQTNPSGSTLPSPGNELWSFIVPEFIGGLTRLHDNSPMLQLPSTPVGITPTPLKKNYFVDGSTGVYQKVNANGTINTAYIYVAMRRGGQFIYALDVSTPTNPQFLWKINNSNSDFAELGQTWSQPKVSFVTGYANPVLIFGAGYDTYEDSEPPATDTMGRGIFIVDAITGNLVWKATYGATTSCNGTATKASCTVAGMNYSIPSDITLIDRNGDGYIDRLYAVDTGGNVWRVDLQPTAGNTPDKWQVTQLAALGCNTGACASGTTPRKFFYPADMVPGSSFDAVLVGSGDREHPLYTNASYSVTNRFYMVKDPNQGNDGSSLATPRNETNLTDITPVAPATKASYDNSRNGYYLTLGTGEKVVNAPTTVAGFTYFGTNTPATPSSNSCTTNLGTAKGYSIQPLTGADSFVTYAGGGLPPTAVAGAVSVNVNGTTQVVPFCIGCGGNSSLDASNGNSAIGGGKPPISVPTNRSRTYWYINNK